MWVIIRDRHVHGHELFYGILFIYKESYNYLVLRNYTHLYIHWIYGYLLVLRN